MFICATRSAENWTTCDVTNRIREMTLLISTHSTHAANVLPEAESQISRRSLPLGPITKGLQRRIFNSKKTGPGTLRYASRREGRQRGRRRRGRPDSPFFERV
eukprot:1369187-Pleurochrysis_carterae.AAC.1